ncbi:hypothetical protein IT570_00410 [Candidatus Sumerlaeota bacterium]|nr:hypothetical protein [Candidatus Sumerlaeota bacterium]
MRASRSSLATECRQFSRYLIGRSPSPAIVARYTRACETFSGELLSRSDQSAYRFARRHPWSLGFLDAGCGVMDGANPLRKRLLIASAILEATTDHADLFLPRTRSLVPALIVVAWQGLAAAGKIAVGVPLLLLVRGQ